MKHLAIKPDTENLYIKARAKVLRNPMAKVSDDLILKEILKQFLGE